jgi:hypothetical protein
MTPTPDLPKYLVDAAARSMRPAKGRKSTATPSRRWNKRCAKAHVDIYTIIDTTTEMKEAA